MGSLRNLTMVRSGTILGSFSEVGCLRNQGQEEATKKNRQSVKDFRKLSTLIKVTSDEGLNPENVFLLFTKVREEDESFTEFLIPREEDVVDDFLQMLPQSEQNRIILIKCQVAEEELHLVLLTRIYPWCMVEYVQVLPTLVRLDGEKFLYGQDVSDFNALNLAFERRQAVWIGNGPPPAATFLSRGVILTLRPGECSYHGQILRKTIEERFHVDVHLPVRPPETKREPPKILEEELCFSRRVIEVERRPKKETAVEAPPPPPPAPKKSKKGKGKKKKKGKKGKGKGKKAKGKKKKK